MSPYQERYLSNHSKFQCVMNTSHELQIFRYARSWCTIGSYTKVTLHSPQYSITMNLSGQVRQLGAFVTYDSLEAIETLQEHLVTHWYHLIETLPYIGVPIGQIRTIVSFHRAIWLEYSSLLSNLLKWLLNNLSFPWSTWLSCLVWVPSIHLSGQELFFSLIYLNG